NIYFTDHGFRVMERLRALANEVRIPMAHLALAWVLNRPGISSILIGARHPRQVDQVFEPLQTPLPSDICDRVEKL
ncbi:MAG: aldo/keto reductase, partial [Planctomycetota bacterium]|nr:aldo/keto reductase [Planctomycetota bacterium]